MIPISELLRRAEIADIPMFIGVSAQPPAMKFADAPTSIAPPVPSFYPPSPSIAPPTVHEDRLFDLLTRFGQVVGSTVGSHGISCADVLAFLKDDDGARAFASGYQRATGEIA